MPKHKNDKVEKTEKRLNKIIDEGLDNLPLLTTPRLFIQIRDLARLYLDQNRNDEPSRQTIATLAFSFRQDAMLKLGHDCLEALALAKMLMSPAVAGFIDKPPRLDSISWINRPAVKRERRLSADQAEAADFIIRIWDAFGRYSSMKAKSLGGGGGSRATAAQPVDGFPQDLWDHHKSIYTPWHAIASKTPINRRVAGTSVTIAAITFKILVEDIYPEQVDGMYGLMLGTALRSLKWGLDAYFIPEKLLVPRADKRGGVREGAGRHAKAEIKPAQGVPKVGDIRTAEKG